MIYDERDNLKAYDIGDLENNLSIDINKLKSSSSISIFIDNLRGTEFFPVLSKIYKKNISPFTLEVQLDLYYYLHLWKQKNKYLSHKDKIIAKKIIGSDIDMRNIIWLYRLKKYYNLTGNNVYSYLIPIHYKLSPSYIKELTEQSSYNMKYKLLKTLYGDLFADDFHKDSIESTFIAKKLKLYRYYFWNHHDSIAVLLAYIYFKEVELNNIISLTEGVRYGLAPESIMSLIHNNVRIER
jgi:V/A-type H+-transporting ATPase subunit C